MLKALLFCDKWKTEKYSVCFQPASKQMFHIIWHYSLKVGALCHPGHLCILMALFTRCCCLMNEHFRIHRVGVAPPGGTEDNCVQRPDAGKQEETKSLGSQFLTLISVKCVWKFQREQYYINSLQLGFGNNWAKKAKVIQTTQMWRQLLG